VETWVTSGRREKRPGKGNGKDLRASGREVELPSTDHLIRVFQNKERALALLASGNACSRHQVECT